MEEEKDLLSSETLDILEGIPEYFYQALLGELVSVFSPLILEEYDGYTDKQGVYHEGYYDLQSSTLGWYGAFKATCKKLGLNQIFDYRNKLEWDESDEFDWKIEDHIIEKYLKSKNGFYGFSKPSHYYEWLVNSDCACEDGGYI